jgi:uncharacterized protein YjbI with pentapeptide repeats
MTEFRDQDLTGSRFDRVSVREATFSGVQIRGSMFNRVRMRGVELVDVDGFRAAWRILGRPWQGTVARAKTFPEAELHRSVDDEWSFIQTLRHLLYAERDLTGLEVT